MKLGIFSWYGFGSPIEERLERIKAAGFNSTMLWWGDETEGDRPFSKSMQKKIIELGLEVENVHVPFDNANRLWSTDEGIRQAHVSEHVRYIEECARNNYPLIVMHVSRGYEIEKPNRYGIA